MRFLGRECGWGLWASVTPQILFYLSLFFMATGYVFFQASVCEPYFMKGALASYGMAAICLFQAVATHKVLDTRDS